jgi:hypothetical protein
MKPEPARVNARPVHLTFRFPQPPDTVLRLDWPLYQNREQSAMSKY